ncbi:MAG: hypothetical protein K0M56_05365 [Kaistella sp.]|nr:hypothetical protein [Kaistella sp.]
MKKYVVFAIAVIVIYFFQSFFLPTGGVGADSLSYFGIASDLPRLETNLFPLGYPVLIKIFHIIFQDYFWASKMLNITMVVIMLLFAYFKKFYFRETVLLFAGKTLFFALNNACSEGAFIFILYFLIYLFHERFHGKITSRLFIFSAALLLVLLFTVRYSGIYIYMGVGVFWMLMVVKRNIFPLKTDFFKVLVLSGLGICTYLVVNYWVYGSFTGENLRRAPQEYYAVYILRDILGVSNVVDPFIGIKPASNSVVSIAFQVLLMLIDLLLLKYFIQLVRTKKENLQLQFHSLLWIISGMYAITLLVSGYFQQIEEMNVRMLAAANFCLFFSFLIIYFKDLKSDAFIFKLGCFFLIFLTGYSLKMPANYLRNRQQIEGQMPKFSSKKLLYNDEREGEASLTTYHIPVVSLTFKYQHTNNQKGEFKQTIAGTVNPQIKWLKYDTIKDKSQVLYTSALILE